MAVASPQGMDENPQISVVILGHSFVKRLGDALDDIGAVEHEQVQEALDLQEARIRPYIKGDSGVRIEHLRGYQEEAAKQFPHAIIVDIGQNDLCRSTNGTPRELAQKLTAEIKNLFIDYERLEVVMYCKVTQKTSLIRSDKELRDFNRHVDQFNYQMLKLTRGDVRIMRWNHRGLRMPKRKFTKDGTHPNSTSGFWKYIKSVSAACRYVKAGLLERRAMGKRAVLKRANERKTQRRQRKFEKWQEKRAERHMQLQ